MSNIQSYKPYSHTSEFKLSALSFTERVVYWTIVLTPLWWLLGIQPLFYPAVVAFLLLFNFRIEKLFPSALPACIWGWLAMSIVMLWTALLGVNAMGMSVMLLAATLVTFFKSYFLIFAGLTLPFWAKVRVSVITRAVAWLSVGYLVNIAIQMAMLGVGLSELVYEPPLARVLPGDKSSLLVKFALFSPFFGVSFPRTILHTPDPPILGLSALLCFLICLGESNRRLRKWALAGCLCALLISFSRLSWLCLPMGLVIIACFRSPFPRQLSIWLLSLTSLICGMVGLTFQELINKPLEVFDSARSNSSAERALVVRKTLEAWQEEFWFGWGIIRGKVWLYEDTYISMGSFSSYAAILYLHGIVGFTVFVGASVLTFAIFYKPAVRGNVLCQRAFTSLVILYMALNATPLSWMAVYFWYFFVWLGAIIKETNIWKTKLYGWEDFCRDNEKYTRSEFSQTILSQNLKI